MERVPVFPIPGDGRFMRQPLYNRDFCRVILWCLKHKPAGSVFDLVGHERIDYVDMIRAIREAKQLKLPLLHVPIPMFAFMLRIYELFSNKPPFTVDQLVALTAGDDFTGIDIKHTFGFEPTAFGEGVKQTFQHPVYSQYAVSSID
jgi:nucleoside-diphosphate-sugar epimerase